MARIISLLICTLFLTLMTGRVAAQNDALGNFRFVDMSVEATSGTTVLQTMTSKEAHVSEDGTAIEASGVTISVPREDSDTDVSVTAPDCLFYFQGEQDLKPLSEKQIKSVLQILAKSNNVTNPGVDDLVLFDQNGESTIRIDLGTEGEIICQNLYWNEASQLFLSGGFFVQNTQVGNERTKVTGGGFVANKDFSDFQPKILGSDEIEVIFEDGNS